MFLFTNQDVNSLAYPQKSFQELIFIKSGTLYHFQEHVIKVKKHKE